MSNNHPLDDLTSSDFIYQVLRSLVALVVIFLIVFYLTPFILEFSHEVYNSFRYWVLALMDYTRSII
jgi:hypothetical protein